MSIKFACESCGRELKVRDDAAGKRVRCPDCSTMIEIPAADAAMDAEIVDDNPFAAGDIKSTGDTADAAAEDRRPCPACGEMIKSAASKCRYCGEVFDPALKKRKSSGGGGRSNDNSHTPAGPGKRLIGVLADGFAALMLMAPGIGLVVAGMPNDFGNQGQRGGENPTLIMMGIGLIALGALALLGLNLYLLITRSQSIGKYLVNTQIHDYETGERADFV